MGLRDVSIEIQRGQKVAFVGPSGCGKSTLLQLIGRFYDPREGQIKVNGIPYSELDRDSLWRRAAWISQEPCLFDGTLRENLVMGLPRNQRPSEEEIWRHCEAAQVKDVIEKLPDGIDTHVSGGAMTQ